MPYQIKRSPSKDTWYFRLKAGNNALTRHRYNSPEGAKQGIIAEMEEIVKYLGLPLTDAIKKEIYLNAEDAFVKAKREEKKEDE
jgi:uncharacterized protein YegP (UPF0339 family)